VDNCREACLQGRISISNSVGIWALACRQAVRSLCMNLAVIHKAAWMLTSHVFIHNLYTGYPQKKPEIVDKANCNLLIKKVFFKHFIYF
jgi:hypothetical protein